MGRPYIPFVRVSAHAAATSAAIAAYPLVAELRAEHAVALVKPMVGCSWAGEPRVERGRGRHVEAPSWFDRWAANYAAALLRKRGPGLAASTLSHLRMRFEPSATVLFVTDIRCCRSKRHPDGRKSVAVASVAMPGQLAGSGGTGPPPPELRLPRETPRLATPFPRHQETPPMLTTDNPPSRKRSVAARARGRRS